MSIRPCPFCNGQAELKEWTSERHGDSYYSPWDGYHVVCKNCGASTAVKKYKHFCDFSKYSVAEFRNNSSLRAAEDDAYEHFKEGFKCEVVALWNNRYKVTSYGGKEAGLSGVEK